MMNLNQFDEGPVPPMRGDLEVYRGPDDGDGTPTYNVHDPIASSYYKISWAEMEVLRLMQPGITLDELLKQLHKSTAVRLSKEELVHFIMQLQGQGLLEEYRHSGMLQEQAEKAKPGWIKWLAFNYLFFKIPIFNPNEFLAKTLRYVRPFMSTTAMVIYAIIVAIGLTSVLVNWSNFISTFTYFFNPTGLIVYSGAIIVTKMLHELAHGYTAKKYGLRVPEMGIAFLILWPVLYTNATDAWRLHNRKERLLISGAGIILELVLAGVSTILWLATSPGILQSLFFVLASVNWISTLAINLNPALRFDGYYILSDLIGVENLHTRAFGMLRNYFYRFAAGADLQDPEPKLKIWKKRFLVGFAAYVYIYRVFLYTAIALLVYYKFTKALGVLLFLLEVAIFFVWPVVTEIQFIHKIRDKIKLNWRLRITSSLIILGVIWFIVPLPVWVTSPAITVPQENHILFTPQEGRIERIFITRGQQVSKNDPIIEVQSSELDSEINVLKTEIGILEKKLDISQLADVSLPFYLEIQTELIQKQAELEGFLQKREQNRLLAKVDGQVYEWDDRLLEGQNVQAAQKIGQIGDLNAMDVIAFVQEDDVDYLTKGQVIRFRPTSLQGNYEAVVLRVSPVRAQKLNFDQLSSLIGGEIPVNHDKELIESYYIVEVHLQSSEELKFGMTGHVEFWGPWRSRALLLVRYVFSVLLRESGV